MVEKINSQSKVLIVCNQQAMGNLWGFGLHQQNIQVALESTPANALIRWELENPDLIIFDVNIPEFHLLELVKNVRAETVVPILLLATTKSEEFMVEAYESGVDECILKPIGPSLLNAKVRLWLRRSASVPAGAINPVKVGSLFLIPSNRHLVIADGQPIRLTNLEFRLLYCLLNHPEHIMSVEDLNQRVWGYNFELENTMLKNVVYRLRRKIETDPANPRIIQTVTGVGYKVVVE